MPTPGPKSDTAEAGSLSLGERVRRRWRGWTRAVHRDLGHLAVGLTAVYALSGLAVNHIADWDPNFVDYSRTVELGALRGSDEAIAAEVRAKLRIDDAPTETYRASETQLELVFDQRTVHVDTATGRVVDEGQRPRLLLRAANWLHLNRGKKSWTLIADAYAAGLLLLAVTGMVMLPGRKGLLGRGGVLVLIGVAIPIAYVHFSGGP